MTTFEVLRHDSNSGDITEREPFTSIGAAVTYAAYNNRGELAVGYPEEYSVWVVDSYEYRYRVDISTCEYL